MKKGTKKTTKPAEIGLTPIKLTVQSLGRKYEATGNTFEECINKIKFFGTKAIGVVTLTRGDYTKERILGGRQMHGLFGGGSPTLKMIQTKQVKMLFGV